VSEVTEPEEAMRPRNLAALALATALPALAAAPPPRAHVDPKGEPDCATCHRTDTPEVFAEWEASRHGVALVKCLVCHGSTGKDFRARPDASACGSCHARELESLSHRAVKDCFACHAPHSLSAHPHR
jgi:hypothetical protein